MAPNVSYLREMQTKLNIKPKHMALIQAALENTMVKILSVMEFIDVTGFHIDKQYIDRFMYRMNEQNDKFCVHLDANTINMMGFSDVNMKSSCIRALNAIKANPGKKYIMYNI